MDRMQITDRILSAMLVAGVLWALIACGSNSNPEQGATMKLQQHGMHKVVISKQVTPLDKELVDAYNTLVDAAIDPPQELVDRLTASLGALDDLKDDRSRTINLSIGQAVEVIHYMPGGGERVIVPLSSLPEGTQSITVHLRGSVITKYEETHEE